MSRRRNSSDTFLGTLWNAAADALGADHRVTPPSKREKQLPRNPHDRFVSSHWGIQPNKVWHDPDIQGDLPEMGKLRELWIAWEDETGKLHEQKLKFPKAKGNQQPPIVAFTTDNSERLYLSQPDWVKARNQALIDEDSPWYGLDDVAKDVGGRQAKWGYPDIDVQILGECTHIVYATTKKGDGPSEYIHEFAEENQQDSVCPVLCIDGDGRLWLCAGSYSVPDEGITD